MQIQSAHSTSTEREMTIDGVEAVTESAPSTSSNPQTPPPSGSSSSSTPSPSSTCSGSKVKKLKPGNITCTASSHIGPVWSCKKVTFFQNSLIYPLLLYGQAFDNKLKIGKKGSAWASRGEGVGAWILATFSRPVKIVKLKVRLFDPQIRPE